MATKNKKRPPARSLATTFTSAFLILSAIILLVSGGLQLFFNIRVQQQAISSQQQVFARSASETVSFFFEENLSVLSASAWLAQPYVISSTEQTHFLQSLLADQSSFRQFAFYDVHDGVSSSVTRAQSASAKSITSSVTKDLLFQTAKKQRYIGPVYFDTLTNEPFILLAVPVINALGEFQGTLVGELNLISIWNSVNQINVGSEGYAYVVDGQGRLIAYKDTARALKGEDLSNIKLVNDFLLNPTSVPAQGISTYTGINGERVVGTFIPLGFPKWAVIAEMPWQEAYSQTIQVGAISIVIIFLLAALAVSMGVLVARRISIPLTELTETASELASGDLTRRAEVRGGREIEALAGAFNNMTDQLQSLIDGLEERVSERTRILDKRSVELQDAAQIVHETTTAQDVESLLKRVAHLINIKYDYYHVGIYLIDDNEEFAFLKAAGGEAGELMLASSHKLRIKEPGIITNVARTGEPYIALDEGPKAIRFQSPLLPYTRSEMVIPLKAANRVLGMVDIQSDKANAFDQNSISVMQIVTDQISIGIERTRLLEGVRQSATELELTLQDNTLRAWGYFMEQRSSHPGYQFDGVTIKPVSINQSTTIGETRGPTPVSNVNKDIEGNGNNLVVPIRLRGQTLGTLNLHFQTDEIPQETTNLVEEAASRLALALENARLVQDAQRLAIRERQINIISAQAQQSTDLDTLLRNTVRELGNALGLPKTYIQIGLLESESKLDQ